MARKYEALTHYLKTAGTEHVPLGFEQVEEIIGTKLPPSARKHRPWWSNNPDNARITHAWLNAGYKSAQVDMAGETLVFVKDETAPTAAQTPSLFGALKDQITIAENVDLTAPVFPSAEWEAMIDKKWKRLNQSEGEE